MLRFCVIFYLCLNMYSVTYSRHFVYFTVETNQIDDTIFVKDYFTKEILYRGDKNGYFSTNSSTMVVVQSSVYPKLSKLIEVYKDTTIFSITHSSFKNYFNVKLCNNPKNQKYHDLANLINEYRFIIDSLNKVESEHNLDKNKYEEVNSKIKQYRLFIDSTWYNFYTNNSNSLYFLIYVDNLLLSDRKLAYNFNPIFKTNNYSIRDYVNTSIYRLISERLLDTITLKEKLDLFPDLSLKTSVGDTLSFQNLKLPSHTFIIFWASWCYGCKELVKKIFDSIEYKNKEMDVVFISFDRVDKDWLSTNTKYNLPNNTFQFAEGFNNLLVYKLGFNYLPYVIEVDTNFTIQKLGVDLW